MKANTLNRVGQVKAKEGQDERGFTLIETSIALVVMLIVVLGAASLFTYAMANNSTARDRELSMAVAQQQMEQLRNATFANINSRVTAMGGANMTVTSAGRPYTVATTVVDTVTGDSTRKTITVLVAPAGSNTGGLTAIQRLYGGVTLVTQRSTNTLGANLGL